MNQYKRWWEIAGIALGILLLVAVTRTLLRAQPPVADATLPIVSEISTADTTSGATVSTSVIPIANVTETIETMQTMTASVLTTQTTMIPSCAFTTAAQTKLIPDSSLNDYMFSEPRVVLTAPTPLSVIEWLPDAEGLLLTRYISHGIESLEILNIATGQGHLYAQRQSSDNRPLWISAMEAVVYSDNTNQQQELRISYGDPRVTESLMSDITGSSMDREGTHLLLFSQQQGINQLQRLDLNTRSMEVIPISLESLLQDPTQHREKSNSLKIAWRFGYEQVTLYGRPGAFLVNLSTKTFCEVNFSGEQDTSRTILGAEWSQDGEYLAMISTMPLQHGQLPSFSKLVLLDTNSNELFDLNLDILFVGDVSWSPDGQFLAVLGLEKEQFENGTAQLKLLIVNVANKKYYSIYPDQSFGNFGIRWGQGKLSESFIALTCPVWPQGSEKWITEQRICVIDVVLNKR